MREIKFRAWDKEQKVMYEVKKVDFSEQKVFCKQYYLNDWKFSEIELMQYTGLKDKNGKEIFEGDIVENANGIRFLIQYDFGSVRLNEISNQKIVFTANFNGENNKTIEVIGNIYENPELLDN